MTMTIPPVLPKISLSGFLASSMGVLLHQYQLHYISIFSLTSNRLLTLYIEAHTAAGFKLTHNQGTMICAAINSGAGISTGVVVSRQGDAASACYSNIDSQWTKSRVGKIVDNDKVVFPRIEGLQFIERNTRSSSTTNAL